MLLGKNEPPCFWKPSASFACLVDKLNVKFPENRIELSMPVEIGGCFSSEMRLGCMHLCLDGILLPCYDVASSCRSNLCGLGDLETHLSRSSN